MPKNILDNNKIFIWKGLSATGVRVSGQTPGDYHSVQHELANQGIELIELKEKNNLILFKKRIQQKDIIAACRHLTTLISASIPLVPALEIVAKSQTNISLQTLLTNIKNQIASGENFHAVLATYPRYFSSFFISLIKTGEESGTLSLMLERLAVYLEKAASLKNQIKKIMYYPTTVIIFGVMVALLLLCFIIPQFQGLFLSFGVKLPFFTRIILQISYLLQSYWLPLMLLLISPPVALFWSAKKNMKLKMIVDSQLLQLPIIGKIIQKINLANMARTLGMLITAGIPLVDAIKTTAHTATNVCYKSKLNTVENYLSAGYSVPVAINLTKIFPPFAIQLILAGEQTGRLDAMLEKIANYYEQEIDHSIDGLTSLLEPFLMLILGLIIGSFVLAMYLPIFKLGSVF
jgi:type IV pilus assembly protein PilC